MTREGAVTTEHCPRCSAPLESDHTDLECAVELVTDWLEDHGHHELAQAVAVATDPNPPTEADLAEIRLALRQALTPPTA